MTVPQVAVAEVGDPFTKERWILACGEHRAKQRSHEACPVPRTVGQLSRTVDSGSGPFGMRIARE